MPLSRLAVRTGSPLHLTAAAGSIAMCAVTACGEVSYRLVARSGQRAPGTNANIVFGDFGFPSINSLGQTAFDASLYGVGISEHSATGVWSEAAGSLQLTVRGQTQAAGVGAGLVFTPTFDSVTLADSGVVAFAGHLLGPGVTTSNDDGIWTSGLGTQTLVIREGDPAPGLAGGAAYLPKPPISMNRSGQLAFLRSVVGPGGTPLPVNQAIWSTSSGSLLLVASDGLKAPGTGPGVNFQSFGSRPPNINDLGRTAFLASVAGPGVITNINHEGIWFEGWGGAPGLALAVRAGDAAPGAGAGVTFVNLRNPSVNNAGQMVFLSSLRGSSVNGSNASGIWAGSAGALELVARAGDSAPGISGEAQFSAFSSAPVINGAGRVAFAANLEGEGITAANSRGIWSDGLGPLALVARTGDTAPGTGPAMTFLHVDTPIINGAGQVAFRGLVSGSGVVGNQTGIWATDRNGILHLVIRTGALFDFDPDPNVVDLHIVNEVWFNDRSGGEDGMLMSFNAAGQLVFRAASGTGANGVFVATVPAPGATALIGVYGLIAFRRQRRR